MDKLTRRRFLKSAALAASAGALAACQPQVVETVVRETVQVEVEKEVTRVVEQEVTTLDVYWHPAHAYEAYKGVFFEFEDEHDVEVAVQYYQWPDMRTKLLAGFAAGTAPDVIEDAGGGYSRSWAHLGYPMNLDPYIERDGEEMGFPEDWQDAAVKRGQRFDRNWAISVHLTCNLCFYNTDMLEAAGVEYPTDWEEFLAVTQAVTSDDIWGFYVESNPEWTWFWQNGVVQYDEENNTVGWGSEEAVESLRFVTDLIHLHEVSPLPTIEVIDTGPTRMFTAERVAMYFTGPWQTKPVRTGNPDLNWRIGQMLTRKRQATGMAGTNVMMASTTEKGDVGWELIKRIVALETELKVTAEAGMPMPRKSWGQHPDIANDPEMAAWAEGLTYAVHDPAYEDFEAEVGVAVGDLLSTAWQQAIFGEAPARDALVEAAEEANEILADAEKIEFEG
jgi:multiple sugar transport system substrate-binding protein